MKDFWKYVLATIVALLLLSIVSSVLTGMFFGAILAFSDSETTLSKHSVYRLDLDGVLVEQAESDEFTAAFAELSGKTVDKELGLEDVLRNIRLAKENDNIDGIYLKGGSLQGGFASIKEIRDALEDFKESGKFVVAYADGYGQGNYWLASVADKVYVNTHGEVSWSGLSSTLMFYSGALEKLGVEMQVVKVGTFKSAVEPYIRKDMSDANRLQMNVLLQDIWQGVVADVAKSRNLTEEELNRLADLNMAYQSEDVLQKSGLIDSMIYLQDMETVLTNLCDTKNYKLVSHSSMLSVKSAEKYEKNKIAVIYAEGDITDESGNGIVGKKMVSLIDKVAKKDNVKAVVFRVNSPGGSAYASEQIWHALSLLKEKKPLVVSMGDYAASGGYYISCLADTIFAQENTLTGSIGIFGLIPSYGKLAGKLGLTFDGVQTNKMGRMETNMVIKGMSKEERDLLQGTVNRGYELFVSRCAEGRDMTTEQIKKIAEGRVWSGKRALELGLVDAIGNIDDAVCAAAQMAQVENYQVVTYPEAKDKLTKVIESFSGVDDTEKLMLKEFNQLKKMSEKPSLQARLPYFIEIR